MVLYKNVDGVRVQMSDVEEQAIMTRRAAGQPSVDAATIYEEWKTSLPDSYKLSGCLAKVVSAINASQVPDAADVVEMSAFITKMASEPQKPEII